LKINNWQYSVFVAVCMAKESQSNDLQMIIPVPLHYEAIMMSLRDSWREFGNKEDSLSSQFRTSMTLRGWSTLSTVA